MRKEVQEPDLADDLLSGGEQIAAYLGWPKRRVFYAAQQKLLPIKSVGRLLIARKSELNKATSCVEAA